jgi:hypothetical protein
MTAASLYARILGASYERLAPILKNIHDTRATKRYVGRCDIRGGTNLIAKVIARFAGLPTAKNDVPVEVTILRDGRGEGWTRMFGTQRMSSRLLDNGQRLQERLGPLVLTFELAAEAERIVWSLHSARLAWIPLPISWLLVCAASESIENGRYCFDVSAHVRGIGLIVHYQGWLVERDE